MCYYVEPYELRPRKMHSKRIFYILYRYWQDIWVNFLESAVAQLHERNVGI